MKIKIRILNIILRMRNEYKVEDMKNEDSDLSLSNSSNSNILFVIDIRGQKPGWYEKWKYISFCFSILFLYDI